MWLEKEEDEIFDNIRWCLLVWLVDVGRCGWFCYILFLNFKVEVYFFLYIYGVWNFVYMIKFWYGIYVLDDYMW